MSATAVRPPRRHRGMPVEVRGLRQSQRAELGLSHRDSIVEVIGSKGATYLDHPDDVAYALVQEAVAYAREKGITTVDTETTGLDPFRDRIILLQLGDQERQYILWWQTLSDDAKELVRELLVDETVRKVGFNLKFDMKMLVGQEGPHWLMRRVVDCQIIEQVLNSGLMGKIGQTMKLSGMGPTAERWLGIRLVKDEDVRTGWGQMVPGRWYPPRDDCATGEEWEAKRRDGAVKLHYAADDACVPVAVLAKQAPWITQLGLADTVRLEMEFLPELVEMEMAGLLLDWDEWAKLAQEAEDQLRDAKARLDALFGVTVTYSIDLDGDVTVERDKNYGAVDELKFLIGNWMREHYGIEVVGNNQQFKEAILRHNPKFNPMRLEKLFEAKLVPSPHEEGKNVQVGYPLNTDYIDGSDYIKDPLWEPLKKYLPKGSFKLTSTDSDDLKFLKILHETPDERIDDTPEIPTKIGLPPELVDPIIDMRVAITKVQRYAWGWKDFIHPMTGRVHPDTTQAATSTGRLSSKDPNLQNLPALQVYRTAVCKARKGWKICGADFSQIEPRIIAQLADCRIYMRVFWSEKPGTEGFEFWCDNVTEPLDLYGAMGAELQILPREAEKKRVAKAKENKPGRGKSKTVVLGLGYGTGKPKYHISLCLDTGEYYTREESDGLYDGFFTAAWEVKQTLNRLSDLADPRKSKRKVWHPYVEDYVTYAETLGGRKRFFDAGSPNFWTEGRNAPIQGTGADILKRTVVELGKEARKRGIPGRLLLTAHDELVGEAPEEYAEQYAKLMERVMSKVGKMYCPNVPITAEAYVHDHWLKD